MSDPDPVRTHRQGFLFFFFDSLLVSGPAIVSHFFFEHLFVLVWNGSCGEVVKLLLHSPSMSKKLKSNSCMKTTSTKVGETKKRGEFNDTACITGLLL